MANGNPIIGYQNLFESASVITTSVAAAVGFEVENIFSGFTFDFWKPGTATASQAITIDMGAAVDVDYFAVAGYTFTTPVYMIFKYSNDNFAAEDVIAANYLLAGSEPVMIRLPAIINRRYWRFSFVSITGATHIPIVSNASFGVCVQVPEGLGSPFVPPHLSMDDTVLNNDAQGGAFIGRSIQRFGSKTTITLSDMESAWVRGVWFPFMEHARSKPFWLDWSDRYNHNLLRYSEDVTDNNIWNDVTGRYTVLGKTVDPFGGNNASILQLDVSPAVVRQRWTFPDDDNDDYSVRFWCILLSGTLTSSTVDIAEGVSKSFTPTGTWTEFQLNPNSGGHEIGHIDFVFSFSAGTPTISIFALQCVKGNVQLPYQKTGASIEEAAYCWTDGDIKPPSYSSANRMDCTLAFKALTR